MKELQEYRLSLIDRLVGAAHEFRAECLAVQDCRAPLEEAGWNVHQLAVHTRDIDKLVYGSRTRRTAVEYNPEFQNFDGDAYMAEHYSASAALNEILDELVANVEGLAQLLRGLPDEAWSRESRHITLGRGFTLQTWVERNLAHMEEHLDSIRKRKDRLS